VCSSEIARLLKPGGCVQVADICVEKPVRETALGDTDLWTGWIAGACLCRVGTVIIGGGLLDVEVGLILGPC
jgi:hypothetical protein